MGHAGAIISGGKGTAKEKMQVMRKSGIIVVESPAVIGDAIEKVLKSLGQINDQGKKGRVKSTKKAVKKNIRRVSAKRKKK
jgi:23S rRNA A2030 N6-methylase RlmJ